MFKMRALPIIVLSLFISCDVGTTLLDASDAIIADHTIMREIYDGRVSESAILAAKEKLRIGYGHTSHGSQIVDGMDGLVGFVNANNDSGERFHGTYPDNLFTWSRNGTSGSLELFEGSGYNPGYLDHDCGYAGWDDKTRTFLDDHPGFNVIMWSWCGQVDSVNINNHYLKRMEALESDYPGVTFVYMTGHLEGGSDNPADNGVLAANNAIRNYCKTRGKVLFDFADIEKYNLDGRYFGDRYADDACNYSGGNWALEWQSSHTEGRDWYSCGSAHSQPVNANQKAYAIWWLWAEIAARQD